MFKLSKRQISDLPMWLPIEGFPNYEVNCREGIIRNSRTLKVLNPNLNHDGYPHVGLCKDGKGHTKKVHRIVALTAFSYYDIPTDGLCVCHLDEERNDPRISNLALGTIKENGNFPKARKRLSEATKGEKNPWYGKHLSAEVRMKIADGVKRSLSKRVGAYKNGELVMIFQSTCEAGRNGFNQSLVSECCRGKRKHHHGYEWFYI